MKNNRNHAYRLQNTLLTNMTASEVEKLDRILNPVEKNRVRLITLEEYIERFNPSVRRWVSKSGKAMVEIEILHDKIGGHLCCNPFIVQQEKHLSTVTVTLKEDDL